MLGVAVGLERKVEEVGQGIARDARKRDAECR